MLVKRCSKCGKEHTTEDLKSGIEKTIFCSCGNIIVFCKQEKDPEPYYSSSTGMAGQHRPAHASKRKEAVLGSIIGVSLLVVDCAAMLCFIFFFKPHEMNDGLGPIYAFVIGVCAPTAMIFAAILGIGIVGMSLWQLISGRGDVMARIKRAFQ